MTKLCANLSMLFNEYAFLDRFAAAAKAGFKGVEYLFPYDFDAKVISEQLKQHQLTQVLFNLPAGDWAKGERGIAVLPDRVDEFKAGVERAIQYATVLGCKQVNVLAGIAPKDTDPAVLEATFVSNIRYAADRLEQAGIRLLIEAINTFDIKGFYVNGTQQTLDLIKKSGSKNIYFQYDIYHMQRMEGELAATIKQNLAQIAHLQLADNPGRHEPGTGEINYPFLLNFIKEAGYQGWIGCEYNPAAETEKGLSWAKAYL